MGISRNDLQDLAGATVIGADGDKIGDVIQIYLSDITAEPTWATVKTGLFGTQESFVPLRGSSFQPGELHVAFDKATVKDAPRVDADGHLTPEEEDDLYRFYGITDEDPADRETQLPDQRTGRSETVSDDVQSHAGNRDVDVDHRAGREVSDGGERDGEKSSQIGPDREADLDAVTPGETRTRMRRYVVTEHVTQTVEELPDSDDRA